MKDPPRDYSGGVVACKHAPTCPDGGDARAAAPAGARAWLCGANAHLYKKIRGAQCLASSPKEKAAKGMCHTSAQGRCAAAQRGRRGCPAGRSNQRTSSSELYIFFASLMAQCLASARCAAAPGRRASSSPRQSVRVAVAMPTNVRAPRARVVRAAAVVLGCRPPTGLSPPLACRIPPACPLLARRWM